MNTIPYARDDFWSNIPEDCKQAIRELKRLKVHRLAGYDYEDNFANVWWLILHEVDMWDEGIFRKEADAKESDPQYMDRAQANAARKWLARYEHLFQKYAKLLPDKPYGDGEDVCYTKTPV